MILGDFLRISRCCFFWLEGCPGHSGLCCMLRGLHVLVELVGVPAKPPLASWAEPEELPVPGGGKGSWEKSRVVPVPRLSAFPEERQPGLWPDSPFLTSCCSSLLVQSLVWCLGRAVPCWLEEWGRGGGDLSETLHCRALPLLPESRPHL